jgi:O-antigen ligase
LTYSLGATRVHSTVGGADEAGALLFVILGFALLRHTIRLDRGATGWLPVLVVSVGIVATLTRTAIVAACVLFFFWSLQRQVRTVGGLALRVRLLLLFGMVGVVAVLTIGTSALQSRLSDVNPNSSGASFAQGRGQIWSAEFSALRADTPLDLAIGRGIHSSYAIASSAPHGESPHNLWLWLSVEMGLAGLLAYAAFYWSLISTFLRARRERRFELPGKTAGVAAALLAGYFVVDLFILTPPDPSNRWYLMLFIGAALRAIATAGLKPDGAPS